MPTATMPIPVFVTEGGWSVYAPDCDVNHIRVLVELPYDPMGWSNYPVVTCQERTPDGKLTCVRTKDHTGRHLASDGIWVLAVWH